MTETVLYRHYDADDIPIYYGISGDNETRQSYHGLYSVWPAFSARCVEEVFATRKEAQAAERAAIEADRPIFNRLHNGSDAIPRAVEYLARHERFDLLEPRSPRGGYQRNPALIEFVESRPLLSDGTRHYEGVNVPRAWTDQQAYSFYEHGMVDCPCPIHLDKPIRQFR